jgi:hypothetical protein
MVNSFQFTREVRLGLTHQRTQRRTERAAENCNCTFTAEGAENCGREDAPIEEKGGPAELPDVPWGSRSPSLADPLHAEALP